MRQSRDVTEPECFTAAFAERDGEEEAGRNPGKTGDANLRKCCPEHESSEDGERKAAVEKCAGREFFQSPQLASKVLKGKFWDLSVVNRQLSVAAVQEQNICGSIIHFRKIGMALTFAKLCKRFL